MLLAALAMHAPEPPMEREQWTNLTGISVCVSLNNARGKTSGDNDVNVGQNKIKLCRLYTLHR
jgi:hypothetical protein